MNRFWRLTAYGSVVLGLGAFFLHSRPVHGQEVAPPPRAARPTENVDLQVPAGMSIILETAPPSKHSTQEAESIVEGDATIVVARQRSPEEARRLLKQAGQADALQLAHEESMRLLKEAEQGDALRLRVRQSRVTVRRGQPDYPSQIFIEPLAK
jgi:hypothetical protein